jgi:hypothetical protein
VKEEEICINSCVGYFVFLFHAFYTVRIVSVENKEITYYVGSGDAFDQRRRGRNEAAARQQ